MRKMRSGLTVLVACVAFVLFVPLTGYSEYVGVFTQGTFKNHPEDWAITTITMGGVTYNQDHAIYYMSKPSEGDKTYDLYSQLCAAILNMYNGADTSCIADTIQAADEWLETNYLGSDVEGSSLAWSEIDGGEELKDRLDAYNNGELFCALLTD